MQCYVWRPLRLQQQYTIMVLSVVSRRVVSCPSSVSRLQSAACFSHSKTENGGEAKVNLTKYNKVVDEDSKNTRYLHYNSYTKPTPANIRERNTTVTSYYNQQSIDKAAAKQSVRLTPSTIMYAGHSTDGTHIMVCSV